MSKIRHYVGVRGITSELELFATSADPETIEYVAAVRDRYAAVIGPFKTERGATIMALYGRGNPHMGTVEEVERLARESKKNTTPKYGEIPAKLPSCPVRIVSSRLAPGYE